MRLEYELIDFLLFQQYYQANLNYDYYLDKKITFPNTIFKGMENYNKSEKDIK